MKGFGLIYENSCIDHIQDIETVHLELAIKTDKCSDPLTSHYLNKYIAGC